MIKWVFQRDKGPRATGEKETKASGRDNDKGVEERRKRKNRVVYVGT